MMMDNAIWIWGEAGPCHMLLNTETGLVYGLNVYGAPVTLDVYSLHADSEATTLRFDDDQAIGAWAQLKNGINGGIKARPESPYAGLVGWMAGRLDEAQQAMAEWTAERKQEQAKVDAELARLQADDGTGPRCSVCGRAAHTGFTCAALVDGERPGIEVVCPACGHEAHWGQVCAFDAGEYVCKCQQLCTPSRYRGPRRFA
jgi:hypothetical protein